MTVRRNVSASKVGLAPGTMLYTGRRHEEEVRITRVRYGPEELEEMPLPSGGQQVPRPGESGVTWINVDGLHDTELIAEIGGAFGLHPLALEDIVSVGARPQMAEYENQVFASLKMLSWNDDGTVRDEHVSLVLGPNWLLSFQERAGDVFGSVRERLRAGATRIRSRGADYLWYALLDAVVDHYLLVVGELETRADALEQRVWEDEDGRDIPSVVQAIRRESLVVRGALRPLRDQVDRIVTEPPDLVQEDTRVFLRDLRQHLLELSEALETIREVLGAVMDAHLSRLSARANDVMRVLTLVATVFIPITFVAGVYGMNFEHMPELAQRWGYPVVWAVMLGMALAMLAYFRRKGWL